MSIETVEALDQITAPQPVVIAAMGKACLIDGTCIDLETNNYHTDVNPEYVQRFETHLQSVAMSAGYGALEHAEVTALSGLAFNTAPVNDTDGELRANIQLSFGRLRAGEPHTQTDLILQGLRLIITNSDIHPRDHVTAAAFYIKAVKHTKQTDNFEKFVALLKVLEKPTVLNH